MIRSYIWNEVAVAAIVIATLAVVLGPLTGRGESEGTVSIGASIGGNGYGGDGCYPGMGGGFMPGGSYSAPGMMGPGMGGDGFMPGGGYAPGGRSGMMPMGGGYAPGMGFGSSFGGYSGGISFNQTSGEYRIQLKAIEKAIERLDPTTRPQPRQRHRGAR